MMESDPGRKEPDFDPNKEYAVMSQWTTGFFVAGFTVPTKFTLPNGEMSLDQHLDLFGAPLGSGGSGLRNVFPIGDESST